METGKGQPEENQFERMQQKVRIAELASMDQRLTPETREKNRRAAEMGKMALRMMKGGGAHDLQ